MEITEVRIFPVQHRDERLMAFATIVFDGAFVVRDLRVIKGNAGLFVAMPSRKRSDGTYSDVAHPLNPELRKEIESRVIGEFHRHLERLPKVPAKQPETPADVSTPPAKREPALAEPVRIAV